MSQDENSSRVIEQPKTAGRARARGSWFLSKEVSFELFAEDQSKKFWDIFGFLCCLGRKEASPTTDNTTVQVQDGADNRNRKLKQHFAVTTVSIPTWLTGAAMVSTAFGAATGGPAGAAIGLGLCVLLTAMIWLLALVTNSLRGLHDDYKVYKDRLGMSPK
ncbi:MAG: hypothetical protein CMF50_08000 [Legionellales bacterium]|nr:hypothetical protein [Legionellales bacterium]|tara:strand:+ start:2048 stop:2530 length:483 start_codon:yes stop_codon:yes gene_type:complete